jgi:serine/threonine-protein kinase
MILAGSMASAEYLQRFQSEVRASARIDHEGIARVYDTGAFNGLPYLAMQYVEGPSLADYLRSHHPEADWSVRCVIQLARTVAYLHSQGIVHRDLKPANILIAQAGPKITDFGLAKLLEEDCAATRSGAIVGTPNYMAPEQARGDSRSVGPAADIHALGAILYELLVGQPPFARETSMATLLDVMGSEPVPPRRRKPAIHPDLDAICLKCLEKAPERRFASASELADALERHLRGEDVPQARLNPLQKTSRWFRRNPALASRLAILVVCVLILYSRFALLGGGIYGKKNAGVTLRHLTLIFAVWIGLSWLFQRFLRQSRGLAIVPYVWAVVDVGILTAILLFTDSLVSPIDIGYPLLVAASGLWLRESLVWFTLGCAVAGYGGATVIMYTTGYDQQLHRHVIFLAGLVTLAFLVLHFVQRFRALSRFYDRK